MAHKLGKACTLVHFWLKENFQGKRGKLELTLHRTSKYDLYFSMDFAMVTLVFDTKLYPVRLRSIKPGLFFGHFRKTQGPKNSTSKKTQSHFLPKNSICRDFLRLHVKNSMQMTSSSVHCLKQMVSIDNYKQHTFFH